MATQETQQKLLDTATKARDLLQQQIQKADNTVLDINQGKSAKIKPMTPITPESVTGQVPLIEVPNVNLDVQTPETLIPLQDDFTREQQRKAQEAETAKEASLTSLVENMLKSPTEMEIQAEQFKKFGVDEKQLRVDQLQTELISEADRLRTLKENILSKGGGLQSGAASEMANAERESYAKQADIALLQLAAQDQLDYATSVADRAVDAMFSRQERINEVLGLVYSENKEQFSKEEQRLFETKQADRNRRLEAEKEEERLTQSIKIEALRMAQLNGAPQSVIDTIARARNPEEVITVGGQWGNVDMLERQYKRQQIASSRTNQLLALASAGDRRAIKELGFDPAEKPKELDPTTRRNTQEQYTATGDLLKLATEYKALVDNKGFTNEIFGDSETLGRIDNLRAQMTAVYKDAKKLGTLDSGLLTLMDQILGDKPTSSIIGYGEEGNIFANVTGKRSKRISSAMDTLIEQTQIENARAAHLLGESPWQSDPLSLGIEKTDTQTGNASTDPLGLN